MLSHAHLATLTIRPAEHDDVRPLAELAGLDSARPLAGDVLLAEGEGGPLAAIEVDSGRVVADPFRPTHHEAELLRARAAQLRPRRRTASRRVRRRAIGRLAGATR
ncbi:MAG TPA: hypothetical protein VHF89_02500 [Solirubrobacteraceae bacterium]|nr:hypothetical protein [Solirubrobacteraceae bacterium]